MRRRGGCRLCSEPAEQRRAEDDQGNRVVLSARPDVVSLGRDHRQKLNDSGSGEDTVDFRPSKPVVDKTGLDGQWDFTLKWTPDYTQFPDAPESMRKPADDGNAWPSLFTAIQEQLGLKLEAQKADAKVSGG